MKTVLITGCSSGYGLQTALHFHAKGWNVIATMRKPQAGILPDSDRMHVLALDVTQPDSIAATVKTAGPIDLLVNNAGIGAIGALEATPLSTIRELFETNTFGVMAMMQAVIPQFRQRQSGAIVNVTSSTTLASFPLASAYTASKNGDRWAHRLCRARTRRLQHSDQAGRTGLRPRYPLYRKRR
jgi:NAD(P)-dependent dehydrogenase (short-subunit alcohol dehydrogenase family)